MSELTKDILKQLAEPFPAEMIEFKPGATTKSKDKALALAYVEMRHYIDRLNKVIGANWSDEYQFINSAGEIIKCGLTIYGVTRWDIGEKDSANANTAITALAQSFKRACVKFGLGRHLYAIESVWVAYDADKKRFTDQALTQLKRLISGEIPPKPKAEPEPVNENGLTPDQIRAKNRVLLIARIKELNGQLAKPDKIDLIFFKEATEAELTAYGIQLRKRVDEEAE